MGSLTVIMHSGLANMLHQMYRNAKQGRFPSVKLNKRKAIEMIWSLEYNTANANTKPSNSNKVPFKSITIHN